MDWFTGFVTGAAIGAFACLVFLAQALPETRDECRAANPGYECDVGWVRGEAFQ